MKYILLLFTISAISLAQQTGSFNTNIEYMGEQRVISMHVPADYNPSSTYSLLVGLHGLGDNSTNLRDVLINQANWESIFPNTIFAFLDGGDDAARDFYAPAGDEEIIPEAISLVSSSYSIDKDEVILQGFSLGGRSALKYGLDHPEDFKGLVLHTPAFQGILDVNNDPIAGIQYDYSRAREIPIAMVCGAEDDTYFDNVFRGFRQLLKNNGRAFFLSVPDMGHSIAPNNFTQAMLNFVNGPIQEGLFFASLNILADEDATCKESNNFSLDFISVGVEPVTSMSISLKNLSSNQEETINWTGNLSDYAFENIDLGVINFIDGINNIEASITSVNGETVDPTDNVEIFEVFKHSDKDQEFFESFENNFPSEGWQYISSNKQFGFLPQPLNNAASDGAISLVTFNSLLLFNTVGTTEELITPPFNNSTPTIVINKYSFDYFFKYHSFTFQDGSVRDFSDTLAISISDDCGETWQEFWRKSHNELATGDPILDQNDFSVILADPEPGEWKTEELDIDLIASQLNLDGSEYQLKFSYTSGQGGTFFMDNLRINEILSVGKEVKQIENLYPNPASETINYSLNLEENDLFKITVSDIAGNEIFSKSEYLLKGEQNISQNISLLETGIYFVKVTGASSSYATKFVVK